MTRRTIVWQGSPAKNGPVYRLCRGGKVEMRQDDGTWLDPHSGHYVGVVVAALWHHVERVDRVKRAIDQLEEMGMSISANVVRDALEKATDE